MTKSKKLTFGELGIWLSLVLFVVLSIFFYFSYIEFKEPILRAIYWFIAILICLSIFLASNSAQGIRSFMYEARIELRKVTWPTRQETLQTTLLVLALVVLVSVVLWMIDSALFYMITAITGQS